MAITTQCKNDCKCQRCTFFFEPIDLSKNLVKVPLPNQIFSLLDKESNQISKINLHDH